MIDIIDEQKIQSIETTVMGDALISKEITDASNKSMGILMPLAFALIIIILAIKYFGINKKSSII